MENNISGNKKYLFGFVILVLGFFAWRYISNPLIITVNGTGKVSVKADSARFSATVVATGDNLATVVSDLNAKVSALRLTMVNGNVNEKNITQSQMQVTPLSAVVAGAKGYSASVTIFAQTAEVSSISDLVVKLYESGAAIVSQPVVEVEKPLELENTAVKEALAEADKNAKYISKMRRKMFRKMIAVSQASSGNVATATKTEAGENGATSSFEVAKAVQVTYWMW